MSKGQNSKPPFKERLKREFGIAEERRMRTATFVQTLYNRSPTLPNITLEDALAMLLDKKFVIFAANLLIEYYEETGDQEMLDKVNFLFGGDEEE